MDTESQKNKFFKLIRQFLRSLEEQFPSSKKQIASFRKLMNNTKKNKFIKYVVSKLEPYSHDISHNNTEIFNTDEPVYLLKYIDFRKFFADEVSDENKSIIWQYLQSLYIMGNFILQGNSLLKGLKNLEDNLNVNDETGASNDEANPMNDALKNMFENLQKAQTQKEQTQNDETNTDNNNENTQKTSDNQSNPFGFIEELASEIANEIEIPDDLKKPDAKPSDLFHSIFFSKENHFANMVSKVGEKIQKKMETGELNQEKLFSQTQDIMSNMQKGLGEMQNDPEMMKQMGGMTNILQSMMGGLNGKGGKGPDMGSMMNMFSSMMGGKNGDDDDEEMPDLSELQDKWRKTRNQEYRAAMRKEQLRKKLDNKRKLLENKARFEEKQKQKDNTEE